LLGLVDAAVNVVGGDRGDGPIDVEHINPIIGCLSPTADGDSDSGEG
jgi:hypothetical protein